MNVSSGLAALFARLPLFAEVPAAAVTELAQWARQDTFEAEAIIFRQGDVCDRIWLVQQGRVKIIRQEEDGREVILEMISPGEVFGGGVLLMPRHPATARAMSEVETVSLDSEHYQRLLHAHPAVTVRLLRMLGGRLHSMMEMQILTGERVERRLAHILLKLADRVGQVTPEGVLIPLALSRQDLADMTGTTLETAIRTVSRFREQGWVKTQRGGYLLLTNEAALRAQAHPS